jgi:hypothetical protein
MTSADYEKTIDDVTLKVRRLYIRERKKAQRLDHFEPGEQYDKYFRSAATMCVENGISPNEFILVQFDALKPYPRIPMLATAKALERYEKHRDRYKTDEMRRAALQILAYERMVKAGWDPKGALADPNQGFDSLFIYIASKARGYDDLAEFTKEQARQQYLCGLYYDDVYQDAVPEELRRLRHPKSQEGTQ